MTRTLDGLESALAVLFVLVLSSPPYSDVSDWLTLRGGIPQRSWLGPLIFFILIDDLQLPILPHKYVDDTTFSEILANDEVGRIAASTRRTCDLVSK